MIIGSLDHYIENKIAKISFCIAIIEMVIFKIYSYSKRRSLNLMNIEKLIMKTNYSSCIIEIFKQERNTQGYFIKVNA